MLIGYYNFEKYFYKLKLELWIKKIKLSVSYEISKVFKL